MKKVLSILEKPIDIAPLVYARIVFGVLISLEFSLGLFTNYGQTLMQGNMHFSYLLTGFIEPWSSPLMIQGHFILNFILGILFAMGFYYRWVTPLFLLSGASLQPKPKFSFNTSKASKSQSHSGCLETP